MGDGHISYDAFPAQFWESYDFWYIMYHIELRDSYALADNDALCCSDNCDHGGLRLPLQNRADRKRRCRQNLPRPALHSGLSFYVCMYFLKSTGHSEMLMWLIMNESGWVQLILRILDMLTACCYLIRHVSILAKCWGWNFNSLRTCGNLVFRIQILYIGNSILHIKWNTILYIDFCCIFCPIFMAVGSVPTWSRCHDWGWFHD